MLIRTENGVYGLTKFVKYNSVSILFRIFFSGFEVPISVEKKVFSETQFLVLSILSLTSNKTNSNHASCKSDIKYAKITRQILTIKLFLYDTANFISCVADSGRVKVFVRVRPPRPQENSRKEPIAVNVQELSSQVS